MSRLAHRPAASAPTSTSRSAPPATPVAAPGAETAALHAGRTRGKGAALVDSLCQSTTFHQARVGETVEHAYSRCSNPTVSQLEDALAQLEGGVGCVAFGTGLAAESALFFATLQAGDHVVLGRAIYGGTVRLLRQVLSRFGVSASFVDSTDLAQIHAAIRPDTRWVFIETPANPTLVLTDIAAVSAVCRRAGVKLAVDNTFLTPIAQNCLDLGADVSVYSTTKHIEGHSAALGGALVTRDPALLDQLRFIRKSTGAIQSPLNAWLTLRGLRTLPLRLREHSRNALQVALWLQSHPGVERVFYPGLADFPQAELARRQHRAGPDGLPLHGGVLSFELRGGTAAGKALLQRVRLASLVEHVGSIETLVTHPATMTHADVPREQREAVGISDGLVRLSVGLEDPADIIADLDAAIDAPQWAQAPVDACACCSRGDAPSDRSALAVHLGHREHADHTIETAASSVVPTDGSSVANQFDLAAGRSVDQPAFAKGGAL